MSSAHSVPVLVGTVPLLYVQSMTLSEGYRIERIMGSRFSQATQPNTKTITIEAVLIGPGRLVVKKELEALALTSRALAASAAPLLAVTGIPVVSGLTISLDMQITDLRFSQSVQKRDALDVSITLQHVPRSSISAALGELGDLALAGGTAMPASPPEPGPVPRSPGGPLTAADPDAPRKPAHEVFLRLPVGADEGFPQAFLLLVEGTTYRITLHVNAPEEELPEPAAAGATVLDLGSRRAPRRAFLVIAVARQDPGGEVPLLRTRIVPGLEYRAGDIVLTFRTLRVAVRNLNAAGAFGSEIVGGVAVR